MIPHLGFSLNIRGAIIIAVIIRTFLYLLFIFVGFDLIIKKLRDLVPVLINCFQEFLPLVHVTVHLDAQSFDCMLYVLQSIDLAVRFFTYGTCKSQPRLYSSIHPYQGPDMTMWDKDVSPVVLKKLLVVFPLNPRDNLSAKVQCFLHILQLLL